MSAIPATRFIRVSGDTQDERSQVADCDVVAGREGLAFTMPDFQLHAISGSKGDKRHLAALDGALAAIQSGTIKAIVVAHSSRLTRRDSDEADLFALRVRMAGGRIYSHDEPAYGAGDLMSKFSALMAHEGNHEYSKTLSGHINRKFRNEIDLNGYFRGCAPAGYSVQGPEYQRYLTPDTGQDEVKVTRRGDVLLKRHRVPAAMIVQAFTDAIAGTGTTELGKRLGLSTDGAGNLLRATVYSTGQHKVMSHRDCVNEDGQPEHGKCLTVIHQCEPLVHPAVQAAAIAALEGRRTGDNVTSRAIAKEDFSGALYCPCGHHTGMHRYYGGGKPRKDGSPTPRTRRYRCNGCGKSVGADAADQAAGSLMSSRTSWWLDRWLVPGNDNSASIDRLNLELRELAGRGLDEDAEDDERARLRAERKRLMALEVTPSRWETGFKTDDAGNLLSEGDHWRSLDDHAARRAWLASGEFRILVSARPGRSGAVTVKLTYAPDEGE